jgi:hypothetical protein
MNSYTITIAPNDDSGAATRLVVDTSGDQVRITDVHLHAPQGLSSGHIPTVDFDLLLRAVTGTTTAPNDRSVAAPTALSAPHGAPALPAATATETAEQPAAPATPKSRARKTTPRATAAPTPRTPRARTSTATSAAKKAAKAKTPPAPAPVPATTRAKAPAKRQTPAKRNRAADNAAAPATSGRVYRRAPEDLAAVFQQVETVAGIAAHYQVPRYTAQGWVSRLRATT